MKDTPSKKVALIIVIAILLWIGSSFVHTLSEERRGRRNEVMQEISSSLTAEQKVEPPHLTIPIQETYREDGKLTTAKRDNRELHALRADFQGEANVEPRARGIFHAQTYELIWTGKLKFDLPLESELVPEASYPGGIVQARSPQLVLPFATRKGLKHLPSLKILGWNKPLKAEPCGNSLCYSLNVSYMEAAKSLKEVEISFELNGMDELTFGSQAQESTFKLTSNWPSPSFRGSFLPTHREVNEKGFSAEWNLVGSSSLGKDSDFAVRFMEPVDVYTLTDRATKYAVLFILSVFGGFFLVEVAAKLRLHPLQYALVGAALVVFYLLVLSLAEHMPFGLAYTISAAASTSLIWFYLAAALRDRLRSSLMGAFLSALYGMLYVILSAEDFALLFGTGLTFSLLAAIMITTRSLDWYQFEIAKNTGRSESASRSG